MRSSLLNPLFKEVRYVKGVGEKTSKILEKLKIFKVKDLLFYKPVGVIDRRNSPPLYKAISGSIITVTVNVYEHKAPPRNRPQIPYKVFCGNDSGDLVLIFFHVKGDYLSKILSCGSLKAISGRVDYDANGILQMIHPDYIVDHDHIKDIYRIEPIYPLTRGITLKKLQKFIKNALLELPELPEWIDKKLVENKKWPDWKNAVVNLHSPENSNTGHDRLAYDELLAQQIILGLIRCGSKQLYTRAILANGDLEKLLESKLPYQLTKGQRSVIEQVIDDMKQTKPMMRLLQGDVGSGKTVVAWMAALHVIEAGGQVCLMAPTDILARQHYQNFHDYAEALGVSLTLLGRGDKGKSKEKLLADIKSNKIQFVIGTHILFQDYVEFNDLRLVIIDEQHRFGVEQRIKLFEKGNNPHILLLSATPIPRTLALTLYGDIDISSLTEKPALRKSIVTRAMPISRMAEVLDGLKRIIDRGEKIYWICPLIEASEEVDIAAVEERYKNLSSIFGSNNCRLLHGRMKPEMRDKAMKDFAYGDAKILVATTVVEVGVDVPDATVIIIEHAEKFGLAQLHQLRGRVGRSHKESSSILLYADNINEFAKQRIKVIRNSNDGFFIAEEDLKLRGSGEILGTKQSGFPEFIFANIHNNQELLIGAKKYAGQILASDPKLKTELGQKIRLLISIFEYDLNKNSLLPG